MRVEQLDYIGLVEAREVEQNVYLAPGEVIILKPELGVCLVVGI